MATLRGASFALPSILLLAGCALSPAPVAPALEGRIWDVRAARFVDQDELRRRLRSARYRLLGEVHDHPLHHEIRAGLIGGLGAPAQVFFEQFDREYDDALRRAQAAGADADALARAGRLDGKNWQWPLHRPLVQAALASGLPVRAANLSRTDARRVMAAPNPPAADPALVREMIDGHCGMLPANIASGMVAAQRARDETLAAAIAASPEPAILIAGNGHVRRDRGVPLHLPPGSSVLSVGFLETRAGEADPRAYARGARGEPMYDYVWFTAPQPRPDPCEAFRRR